MATITRYVNPDSTAGGDGTTNATAGANRAYVSLNAWEAAQQQDLDTGNNIAECICETNGTADTTQCTISGWTTSAADYIDIKTSAGHRHAGVWNTAKYRLSVSAEFNYPLFLSEDHVRVDGLQIEQTHSNGVACIHITGVAAAASSDNRVTSSILRTASTRTTANTGSLIQHAAGKLTLQNDVLYKAGASGVYTEFGSNAPTLVADNCTIAGHGAYAVNRISGTVTLQNCYADGATDAYNGTITRTTCAHSSASVFAGSTASIAHDTTNFTNVTAGSQDYHLVSGASATLKTGGTDLSGTFTTDIDGETRSDWSIGADEIVAAPGGLSIPIAMRHYLQMMGAG